MNESYTYLFKDSDDRVQFVPFSGILEKESAIAMLRKASPVQVNCDAIKEIHILKSIGDNSYETKEILFSAEL